MFRKKYFTIAVSLLLCIALFGCASLQRKFTRRKEKEEDEPLIVTSFNYSKDLRSDELYKKHFLYWKTWHTELIDRLDEDAKKRSSCYNHMYMHLQEMQKYLDELKAKEMEKYRKKMEGIEKDVKERRLTRISRLRIKRSLEKTFRQITKRFSFSDVKENLD